MEDVIVKDMQNNILICVDGDGKENIPITHRDHEI